MYAIKMAPCEWPEIVEFSGDLQEDLIAEVPSAMPIDPAGFFLVFIGSDVAQSEDGYFCLATGVKVYSTLFITRHDEQMRPCSVQAEDIARVTRLLVPCSKREEVL